MTRTISLENNLNMALGEVAKATGKGVSKIIGTALERAFKDMDFSAPEMADAKFFYERFLFLKKPERVAGVTTKTERTE